MPDPYRDPVADSFASLPGARRVLAAGVVALALLVVTAELVRWLIGV